MTYSQFKKSQADKGWYLSYNLTSEQNRPSLRDGYKDFMVNVKGFCDLRRGKLSNLLKRNVEIKKINWFFL